MNAFFKSQSSYYPLVWMCQSRASNRKLNRLHENCLQIIFYSDKHSAFEKLLEKDGSVSSHSWNLHILGIEMYKIKNEKSPLYSLKSDKVAILFISQGRESWMTGPKYLSEFSPKYLLMIWNQILSTNVKITVYT